MKWLKMMIPAAIACVALLGVGHAQQTASPTGRSGPPPRDRAASAKAGEKFMAEIDLSLDLPEGVIEFVAPTDAEYHWGSDVQTGDVNGDGVLDVVIVASSAKVENRNRAGAAYVFFGSWDWSESRDFSTPDVLLAGDFADAYMWGLVVADLDGDGIDDIASGSVGVGSYHVPVVNVVFGRTQWPASLDLLDQADCKISGPGGTYLGAAMTAGDFDADGRLDLAIYAPGFDALGRTNSGATIVIRGATGWPAAIDALSGVIVAGPHAYAGIFDGHYYPQRNVATGDLNGDGVDDLVVASAGVDGPGTGLDDNRGGAFIVFGGSALPDAIDLASDADVAIYGAAARDQLHRVTVTDVDGDGIEDLGLGAFWVDRTLPTGEWLEDVGAVYLVHGRESWPGVFDLLDADYRFLGAEAGDAIGNHRFGDLDRDGRSDLVIGMIGWGPGGSRIGAGRLVVVYGHDFESSVDLRVDRGTVVHGPTEHALLNGWDSSHLADLDNDGGLDLLVGAPRDWSYRGGGAYAIDGEVLAVRRQDIAVNEFTTLVDHVGPLGPTTPVASLANLGATIDTARVVVRVDPDYESTRTLVLNPLADDLVEFAPWEPSSHGSYVISAEATLLVHGQPRADEDPRNDLILRRVTRDPTDGLVVERIATETLVNGAVGQLVAVGRGIQAGATTRLRLGDGDGLEAASSTVEGDTMLVATFDIPDAATEGSYDLHVGNTGGESYLYQDAVRIVEFEGQEIPFGDVWTPFSVIEGTEIEVGFEVPVGAEDLFVLIKKTTHIGYDGTWDGEIVLSRGNLAMASRTGLADLGLELSEPSPGFYSLTIRSQDAGEGLIRVHDRLDAVALGSWSQRDVLRPYGSDWFVFEVPPGTENLNFETEGFGLWSNLRIGLGSLANPTETWYFDNPGAGYHLSGSIEDPEPGTYFVEYVDSAVLQDSPDQMRPYSIGFWSDAEPPDGSAIRVVSATSRSLDLVDGAILELVGTNLSQVTAIELLPESGTPLNASFITHPTPQSLRAHFALAEAMPGVVEIRGIANDGTRVDVPFPVELVPTTEPQLWADIQGRDRLREGRRATFHINYGNRSAATCETAFLIIESAASLHLNLDLPSGLPMRPLDFAALHPDSLITTVINLGRLPAQFEGSLPLVVDVPHGAESFAITAGITRDGRPYYEPIYGPASDAEPWPEPWVRNKTGQPVEPDFSADPPKGAILVWTDYRTPYPEVPGIWTHVGVSLGDGYFIEFFTADNQHTLDVENPEISEIQIRPVSEFMDPQPGCMGGHGYLGALMPPYESNYPIDAVIQNMVEHAETTSPHDLVYSNAMCVNDPTANPGAEELNCASYLFKYIPGLAAFVNQEGFGVSGSGPGNIYDAIMHANGHLHGPCFADKVEENRSDCGLNKQASTERRLLMMHADECGDGFIETAEDTASISGDVVGSTTPEDKFGPNGWDPPLTVRSERRRHTRRSSDFRYRIDFWNREDATAPATEVFVVDTLDVALDPESLNLTAAGFREWNLPLEGGHYFNVDVDMRPTEPWLVNIEGAYDADAHAIAWTFRTLDPLTRELPEDPNAGFLPAITDAGTEIGWVEFTIDPRSDVTTGARIQNQAFVNFDHGPNPDGLYWAPAPKEAPWANVLDLAPPVSHVEPLPATVSSSTINLKIDGHDDGAGIDHYEVFAASEGAAFEMVGMIESETFTFAATNGISYRFYSVAVDHVGHREAAPAAGDYDAATTVKAIRGMALAPSPYVPSRGHRAMTLFGANLAGGRVDIYDKAGDHVQRLEIPLGQDTFEWDVRSRSGDQLASGVYIWVLEDATGGRHQGKFAIIR